MSIASPQVLAGHQQTAMALTVAPDADHDPKLHGTVGQNAELVGAAAVDAVAGAPFWLWNKLTGSSVPAPLDLTAKVYDDQVTAADGGFTDSVGHPIDPADARAALDAAEDQGGIIAAGQTTAGQIADDPTSVLKAGIGPTAGLVPGWVWVAVGVTAAVVVGYYVVTAASAAKALAS